MSGHFHTSNGLDLGILSSAKWKNPNRVTISGKEFPLKYIILYGDSEDEVYDKIQNELDSFIKNITFDKNKYNRISLIHGLEPTIIPMGQRFVSIIAIISFAYSTQHEIRDNNINYLDQEIEQVLSNIKGKDNE